jgi:hypothetical protein
VELSEQKTSLEIRIKEMTPEQRKQYAIELLASRDNAPELADIAQPIGNA